MQITCFLSFIINFIKDLKNIRSFERENVVCFTIPNPQHRNNTLNTYASE